MRLLIAGSGAMGLSLASVFSRQHEVTLCCRRQEAYEELLASRTSPHLPGHVLPCSVTLCHDMQGVDFGAWDALISAVPTQYLRALASRWHFSNFECPILNTAKGLELGSFLTPCDILKDLSCSPSRLFALSGPSHAEEMALGLPTSLVIAGVDLSVASSLQQQLSAGHVRLYSSRDLIGVELGGALKNVIAIAAGMGDGMGFGMNTKSAIITRGLAEIRKYGLHRGALAETFSGLSGLGDMITTCCSPYSRNRAFGEARIRNPEQFDREGKLVEGASTVCALMDEVQKLNFDMPLSQAVHAVIYHKISGEKVMQQLLTRPFKEED